MKQAVIIDIQHTTKEKFPNQDNTVYLREISFRNFPVQIALTPYQRENWRHLEDHIGTALAIPGSGLLLEGPIHVCMLKNHKVRDPYHQDICTSFSFNSSSPYTEIFDRISEGKEFLEKAFGKNTVRGYIPPQHLHNKDVTKAVAETGLEYLITNATLQNIFPYKEGRVKIVPSASAKHNKTKNPVVHFYYDLIQQSKAKFDEVTRELVSLDEIETVDKTLYHSLSQAKLRIGKQLRDAKRLIKWAVDKETRKKEDTSTKRAKAILKWNEAKAEVFGK